MSEPIDASKCAPGYYWVLDKDPDMSQEPQIMECRNPSRFLDEDDGVVRRTWWHMGWDVAEDDMDGYVILGEVAPYSEFVPQDAINARLGVDKLCFALRDDRKTPYPRREFVLAQLKHIAQFLNYIAPRSALREVVQESETKDV